MNSLSTILSSSTGTQASGGSSVMFIVVYIAIFAAIIYFMMIRPQKKQKAKTDQMLSQMEPGDNIMTTSGFYGTILDVVDDSTIIVEFVVYRCTRALLQSLRSRDHQQSQMMIRIRSQRYNKGIIRVNKKAVIIQ